MSTRLGKVMGSHELVFVGRALQAAARGAPLGSEAKRALRALVEALDALDVARRDAPPAPDDTAAREGAEVDTSLRALDLYLEAFATAGRAPAAVVREALFPHGRAFVRARGVLKQGLVSDVLGRAAAHEGALAELGATSFVEAVERAHAAYVAKLGAKARRVKPAGVRGPLDAAREALRRYAAVVSAAAVLAGDEQDRVLLAPLANRLAPRTAPPVAADTLDPEVGPPSVAA